MNNLITNNQTTNFYNHITKLLLESKSFIFNVAFINFSGVQLLLDVFSKLENKNIKGKILTSTYLNFTQIKALEKLKEFSNMDNLVIAGGVALNCSANGKIEKSCIFKNIFIPPFPSDSGTAVGSALELYHQLYSKEGVDNTLRIAGLGISYSQNDTLLVLKNYQDRVQYSILEKNEMYNAVAKEITKA